MSSPPQARRMGPQSVARGRPAGAAPTAGPLVSVLLPTYNRRRYLPEALASAVGQTYRHLEIIVINDGGEDVSDIVRRFDDPRVVFIDRKENRGKPFSLNEALARARGQYVAYLDDDDTYYPSHVETLVRVLESQTECQVAYSDLYKVYCRLSPDGRRTVLSKHVDISRDFDHFLMLYFNHVLHVSLMHHRDLLDRTGLYNVDINILIDWDMTRRLAFFSDFCHVPAITGEFYSPISPSDRISFQRRQDSQEYLRNVLAIRTTKPPKPWPKIEDLSVILLADHLDERMGDAMRRIWRYTFYPYTLYVPLPAADIARLNMDMPNVVLVPVGPSSNPAERIDLALRRADAPYAALVPWDVAIEEMWIENPLFALLHSNQPEALLLDNVTRPIPAVVLRRADLDRARQTHPHLPLDVALGAAGIHVRPPREHELPFQFDELLRQAKVAEANGDWRAAAALFEQMARRFHNELWMKTMAARACFEAGDRAKAGLLSAEVNRVRPTVDTLLLEAKVRRQEGDFHEAIRLLEQAKRWLDGDLHYARHRQRSVCSAQT